jgi:hypothetical protein
MSMTSSYRALESTTPRDYSGVERRSNDPVDRLGRTYDRVCTIAVDSLQITAALEADGINDDVARAYGKSTVFEVAEELYRRVPLRLKDSTVSRSRSLRWRELPHGLLFALPGFFYPAIISLTSAAATTLTLALAVIVGWGWSQLTVRLAYLLIGRTLEREAAQLLRLTSVAGILVVSLLAAATYSYLGPASFLAIGQMVYQMTAAVLILYGREDLLFSAMFPAVLVSIVFFVAPGVVSAAMVAVAVVMSLLGAIAAAAHVTARGPTPLADRLGLTGRDVADALPFLIYGVLCAVFVALDTLRLWSWSGSVGLGLAIAPLVLSMGALEWQLRRFREDVAILLWRTHHPRVFADGVWGLFLLALGSYGGLLALLSVGLYAVHGLVGADASRLWPLLLANWLLGCAFFVGFALISQNRIGLVIVFLSVALALHVWGFPTMASILPFTEVSYVLSCLLFGSLLLLVSKRVLGEIHNYRYDVQSAGSGRES